MVTGLIVCTLCPHACRLEEGEKGKCGQRVAKSGQVVPLQGGKITAIALDPVEKKPLYHFFPGSTVLSLGGAGCNFRCTYCQNWQIAQDPGTPFRVITSRELLELALDTADKHPDCIGVAFTYNEPLIGYEFVLESAQLLKQHGLQVVLVTNGYINPKPWRTLLEYVDAVNIDVKAFDERFYQEQCGASLAPVLRNVEAAESLTHVEVTYLVIPGLNDSESEFRAFCRWLAGVSPDTPLHLTRYFPNFKLRLAPTPLSTLGKLSNMAEEVLEFVYLGNTGAIPDTVCPKCGTTVISRSDLRVSSLGLTHGKCPLCGREINVVTRQDGPNQ